MKIKKYLSPTMLFAAAIIWGLGFVAQGSASEVGAFTIGALRSVVAGIFLVIMIMVFDKATKNGRKLFSKRGIDLTRAELVGGILCGAVLAIASAFQQSGISSGTDPGKAAFITALYVVLVPIYALALKKRAPVNVWISIGISVIGFYLLCIKNDLTIVPSDLLCIASALTFPIHILVIDHYTNKCDGIRLSCVQFFAAAIVNAVIAIIFERGASIQSVTSAILPILYLGICSSGIAYTLQILGQKGTNPAAASIILSLESVFGALGAAIIIGNSLSLREYIGCAVILFAVILSQFGAPDGANPKS